MYAILSLPITNYSYVAKGKSKGSQPRLWIIVLEELNTTTCLTMKRSAWSGVGLVHSKDPLNRIYSQSWKPGHWYKM